MYNDAPMQVVGRIGRFDFGLFIGPRYGILTVRCNSCSCEEVAEEFERVRALMKASPTLIRAEASEELDSDAVKCSDVFRELGIKMLREVRLTPNDIPVEVLHGEIKLPGVGVVTVTISGYTGSENYRLSVALTSPPKFSVKLLAREACSILDEFSKLLKNARCTREAQPLRHT